MQAFRDEKGECIAPHNPVTLVQHKKSRLESKNFLFSLAWYFIMMDLGNLLLIYEGLPQALTWGTWPCCPHPRSHKLVIQSAESRSQEGQRTSLWSKWGWVVIGSRTARNPLARPAPFVLAGFIFSIEKKWVEGRVTGPTTSPETLILTKTKTANSIR